MKKKKQLVASCVGLLAFSIVFAYAVTTASITNLVSTQGVDIRVTASADTSLFAPGRQVRYAPLIENRGMASYVRFKTKSNLPSETFYGLSEDWIKRGEYLYYTKPIKSKERIETYDGFTVPKEWDKAECSDIMIIKTCDAIQAKHFSPDFSAEEPWGNVVIKESSYDGSSYVNEMVTVKPLELGFKNAEEQHVSSDDIMALSLVPGDTISNYIDLTNNARHAMDISFMVTAEDNDLLKAGKMKLVLDEETIYEGDLKAVKFSTYQQIASMKPSESQKLYYKISLPAEMDNAYQQRQAEFQWRFLTEETLPHHQMEFFDAPKTGDIANIAIFSAFLVIVIGSLIVVRKKKDNDNEKNQ